LRICFSKNFDRKVCFFAYYDLFLHVETTQKMKTKKAITLKTLTKSSVWDIQESDVFRMLEEASKDADFKDNIRHYTDILKSAFDIETIKVDKPEVVEKYEDRGYKVGVVKVNDNANEKWAVKKRPIYRVTDLTYENIRHISARQLIEVLERNFGGGWESLPQSIQDIIESGFDVSTTTLPTNRIHRPGGMYDKKTKDGYEVLEIPKGTWTEAVFVKAKPETERPRMKFDQDISNKSDDLDSDDLDKDEDVEDNDDYNRREDEDEDEDNFDDEKISEEIYRTQLDEDPVELSDDLNIESDDEGADNY
jgi:hypothetical protein